MLIRQRWSIIWLRRFNDMPPGPLLVPRLYAAESGVDTMDGDTVLSYEQ